MVENPEAPKTDESASESKRSRSPYAQLPFDLTTDEMAQSGTQKMLLGEVERLSADESELKDCKKRLHQVEVSCAVLRSKFKQYTALEILYTMSVAAAFAVFGYLPSVSPWKNIHYVALAIGIALVGVAIVAKWRGVSHEG